MNYGYIPDKRTPDNYVLGASPLPKIVLQPAGQWDPFLPSPEYQRQNGVETQNCTVYGTENALKILFKRQFGLDLDFSERYVGIAAETTPQGNSPHKVIEVIRKDCGLLPEEMLPFDSSIKTWEDYYSPNPLTAYLWNEGRKILDKYEIGHEWVLQEIEGFDTVAAMTEALTYSPLGVAVNAWPLPDENGIYHRKGIDTHWCLIYGYRFGSYWLVRDTYDQTDKKLAWDYPFYAVKRYSIKKLETPPKRDNWVVDLFKRLWGFLRWITRLDRG